MTAQTDNHRLPKDGMPARAREAQCRLFLFTEEVEALRELLKQYRATYRELKKLRLQVASRPRTEQTEHDLTLISSMEKDVAWVIDYLEGGREPEARKGAGRRLVVLDPAVLDKVAGLQLLPAARELTPAEQKQLDEALALLTDAERQAVQLVLGEGLSYSETAELMGISKGNVSTLVERAQRKFRQRKKYNWQRGYLKVVRMIAAWEPAEKKSPASRRSKFVGR